jgi:hypothetical protein
MKRIVSVFRKDGFAALGPAFAGALFDHPLVFRAGSLKWFLPLDAALKPIERLVPVSCAGYPASTSGLST